MDIFPTFVTHLKYFMTRKFQSATISTYVYSFNININVTLNQEHENKTNQTKGILFLSFRQTHLQNCPGYIIFFHSLMQSHKGQSYRTLCRYGARNAKHNPISLFFTEILDVGVYFCVICSNRKKELKSIENKNLIDYDAEAILRRLCFLSHSTSIIHWILPIYNLYNPQFRNIEHHTLFLISNLVLAAMSGISSSL